MTAETPSCSSTRSALEAALSRATAAPTEAEAFPLFLEELRQAAPALVASESGREGDDDGDGGAKGVVVVDGDSKASSSLRLATPESRSAYDLALRSALSRAMASAIQNGEPVMEHDASGSAASPAASTVRRLLAVASGAAAEARRGGGAADPSAAATATLFSALEDLLEGTPVDQALSGGAFAALEEAAAGPLRRLGWDRCKLPLLRACNGLLARASRRRAPRDCGAVLLFLARAAPLGDKSGLNLMGSCNSASHPVPVEEVGGKKEGDGDKTFDSSGERIDAALYTRFWELQRALQSPLPTLLVPSSAAPAGGGSSSGSKSASGSSTGPEAAAWAEFQASVRAVLAAFARTPVAVDAAGGSKVGLGLSSSSSSSSSSASKGRRLGSASAKRKSGAEPLTPPPPSSSASAAAVGVSYLSSPSIFGLQMRDGAVRRHFLVQVLIALHALRHPPQRLASAAAAPSKSSAAAAAAATATTAPRLSAPRAKQLAEASSLEAAVLSALELVPPEGKTYAAAVRAALAREGSWAAWKGGNPPCPSLERAPVEVGAAAAAAAAAASTSSLPASSLATSVKRKPGGLGAPGPPTLGTPDLDRLWSLQGGAANGEGLRAADRGVAPDVESFLAPVLSEMDPEEGIEDFYKAQRDQVFQWKALRQVAASDWRAFAAVVASPGASDLEAAAAAMFPARVPKGWVSLAAKEEAKARLKKEEEEEREREEKEKEKEREKERKEREAAAEAAAKAEAEAAEAAEVVKEEESREETKAEEKGTEGATAAAAAATTRAGGKRKRDSDEGGEGQQQEEEEEKQAKEEEERGEEKGGGDDGEAEMTDAAKEEEGGEDAAAPVAAADADNAPSSQQQQSGDEEGMEVEEEEEEEEGALDDGGGQDDDKGEDEPSQPRSEGAAAAAAAAAADAPAEEEEEGALEEGGEEQDEG